MLLIYLDKRIQHVLQNYRLLGFKQYLKSIAYERYDVLKLEKNLNAEVKFTFENQLEIQNIEEKHLHIFGELFEQNDTDASDLIMEFKEYLKNGCSGFLARQEDEVIGYVWWGNNKTGSNLPNPILKSLRNELELNDDDVYLFDFLVAPEYRGNSNATKFLCKVFLALSELGYKRAFGWVLADNTPAKWTYAILEFKETKKLLIRRYFLYVLFRGINPVLDVNGHKKLCEFDGNDGT